MGKGGRLDFESPWCCLAWGTPCICGLFWWLYFWQSSVVSGQGTADWYEGRCEIQLGVLQDTSSGDGWAYYEVSFAARLYHNRTDIESPLAVIANEWGSEEANGKWPGYDGPTGDGFEVKDEAGRERAAETYRRSVIDCCTSPGSGAVWEYTDSAACAAASAPKCNTGTLPEDKLFPGGGGGEWEGVHSFGCGLCLECCSQMDYRPDENSYTGYTPTGQYKRTPCYVLTETFDEYVEDHTDGDLDGSLYVRLRHESTYDWWEDPTTRGYFWPIVWCIFAVIFTCVSLVCLMCLVCRIADASGVAKQVVTITQSRGEP